MSVNSHIGYVAVYTQHANNIVGHRHVDACLCRAKLIYIWVQIATLAVPPLHVASALIFWDGPFLKWLKYILLLPMSCKKGE